MNYKITTHDELYHHGIEGMKWGVRRYQNADGSLTAAGRNRYGYGTGKVETARFKADRAKSEAQTSHKLAKKYTDRMDAKAAKRSQQAKENPSWYRDDRADRAKSEAQTSHKLAKKYTDRMDAKAAKKQSIYDELYEKELNKQSSENTNKSKFVISEHDSSTTKKVKNDYNNMSDREFMAKYKTSKKVYAKRVDKYGDPYMNSPLAKTGKKMSANSYYKKEEKRIAKDYQQRINKFKLENGSVSRQDSIRLATEYGMNLDASRLRKQEYLQKHNIGSNKKYLKARNIVNNNLSVLANTYSVKYDSKTRRYRLENK